jgi:hypothetical protein
VTAEEPVVAFVHRYAGIAEQTPTGQDLASAPYAHAESLAALHPFMLLETSSHALPGAQTSDRGLASRGSLLVDDGIPLYDIATNQSPFVALPSFSLQHLAFAEPADAYRYGDLAGGGTTFVDTHAGSPWSAAAAAGSQSAARVGQTLPQEAWNAAFSHDSGDERARADASLSVPNSDDLFSLSALAASDRLSPADQYLDTSAGGLRIAFERSEENRVHASLTASSGGYDGDDNALSYSAKWSDVQAEGGVLTNSRIQFFADAGMRVSSGAYSTSSLTLSIVSGIATQLRVSAGLQTAGDRYELRLGAGAFDMHYGGGTSGNKTPLDAALVTPGFSGSYALDGHWTVEAQGGASFALPTMLETYVYPPESPALEFDRNTFFIETLKYGDLHRFRASLTAAQERVTGLDSGIVHSIGGSLAWQVTPDISVRAWLLRDNDFTRPYEAVYRFGARPQPVTGGSYWATYETAGMRLDAIYRQDLLDYRADRHADGSVSVPLGHGLRVFAATERRAGTRYVTAGLRIGQ